MSTTGDLRTGIKAVIAAISDLSTVTVYDAAIPQHAYDVAIRKPGIVLCYLGRRRIDQGPLSQYNQNRWVYRWSISIVTENWRTPAGAVDQTLGIEEIADDLDALRETSVGTIGGESVFMWLISEDVQAPAERAPNGGPAALVQTWETTEVLA